MKMTPLTKVWIGLLAVAGCAIIGAFFVSRWLYFEIFGRSGVARNVSELSSKIYCRSDPELASFYLNSDLQKLRFTEPIRWHRSGHARSSCSISLTSRVDVMAFKRDMTSGAFASFYPSGAGSVYTMQFLFRTRDQVVVQTWGKCDMSSGNIEMQSRTLEQKVDDSWWYQMTNRSFVVFDFIGTPK